MQGDSGGAVQTRATDGRWYQVGIMSYAISDDTLIIDQNAIPGIYLLL